MYIELALSSIWRPLTYQFAYRENRFDTIWKFLPLRYGSLSWIIAGGLTYSPPAYKILSKTPYSPVILHPLQLPKGQHSIWHHTTQQFVHETTLAYYFQFLSTSLEQFNWQVSLTYYENQCMPHLSKKSVHKLRKWVFQTSNKHIDCVLFRAF